METVLNPNVPNMNYTQTPPFPAAANPTSILDEEDWISEAIDAQSVQSLNSSSDGEATAPSSLATDSVAIVDAHAGHKRVLVTGGAGFLGSHVADALLQRGDDVVLVDSVDSGPYGPEVKENTLKVLALLYGPERVKIHRGDVCDETFLTAVFEAERPEWVCHLAGYAGIRSSLHDPAACIHTNVEGTARVLEASVRFGVRNLVVASSSSVYDGSTTSIVGSVSEDDPAADQPETPYAASKRACELLAYAYHRTHALNVSCLRLFTVYGPRGRPDALLVRLMDGILRGNPTNNIESLLKEADASGSLDFTYVTDVADGILRALDRPHPYQIFNIGQGRASSVDAFATLVQQFSSLSPQHAPIPPVVAVAPIEPVIMDATVEDNGGAPTPKCADIRKAWRFLRYCPRVSLEDGVRQTVEWWYAQGPTLPNILRDEGSDDSSAPESTGTAAVVVADASVTAPMLPTSVSMNSIASSNMVPTIDYQDVAPPVVVVVVPSA